MNCAFVDEEIEPEGVTLNCLWKFTEPSPAARPTPSLSGTWFLLIRLPGPHLRSCRHVTECASLGPGVTSRTHCHHFRDRGTR